MKAISHKIYMYCAFLQSMAAGVPAAFIIAHFIVTRDRTDLEQGLFGKLVQPCPQALRDNTYVGG